MSFSRDKESSRYCAALLASVLSGGLGLSFLVAAAFVFGATVQQRWVWILGTMLVLGAGLHFCRWDNLRTLVRGVLHIRLQMRPKKKIVYQCGRMPIRDEHN